VTVGSLAHAKGERRITAGMRALFVEDFGVLPKPYRLEQLQGSRLANFGIKPNAQ